jgi:membrane protein
VKERILSVARTVDGWLPARLSALVRRLADSEILLSASSLAFYGLVSALPLLVLTFAFVDAVAGDDAIQRFADQVTESGIEGVGQFLDQVADGGGSLTFATALFTIWPATAFGGGLRRALTRHSDRTEAASGVRGRLLALGMVLVLPVLVLAGIPLMFFLTTLSGDGVLATVFGWSVALLAGAVVATVVITAIYKTFTPGSLRLRQALVGALLTAVLTGLFSLLFVLYLQVADTEERFGGGTIALVVLIGIWLFVANILLLGGFETVLELEGVLEDDEDLM